MKKTQFNIVFILLIIIFIVSCSHNEMNMSSNAKYLNTEDIPDGHSLITHSETSVYPYDGILYAMGKTELIAYDLYNDMSCTVLSEINVPALSDPYLFGGNLFVNENYIYILRQDAVLMYSHDGMLVKTISYDFRSRDVNVLWEYPGIFAYGNTVFVSFWERTWNGEQYDSVFRFFSVDTDSETYSESESFRDLYEIYTMTPWSEKDDGTYLVAARCVYQGNDPSALGSMERCVFRYNMKKDTLELITSINTQDISAMDYSPDTEKLYYCENSSGYTVLGAVNRDEDTQNPIVQMLTETRIEEIQSLTENDVVLRVSDIFFTGKDFIIFVNGIHEGGYYPLVSVYSIPSDDAEELNVIYQKDKLYDSPLYEYGLLGDSGVSRNLEYITIGFEEKSGCHVNRIGYSHTNFTEKLRMKLLAGDTDFDIVYMEESSELLGPILNNKLYLPLETHEGIIDEFSQFIDGVDDVMTYDGHIFGIPLKLAAQAVTDSSGAIERIRAIAEDGLSEGKIDVNAVADVLASMSSLTDTITVPVQYYNAHYDDTPDTAGLDLNPIITPSGNHYAELSSLVFVSANSPSPSAALDYMEYLLSDNIINLAAWNDKSYLLKDTSRYYNLEEPMGNSSTVKRIPVEFSEKQCVLTEKSADILTGSRVYTINWSNELSRTIHEIISDVSDGRISSDEGAKLIVSELNYRLFE